MTGPLVCVVDDDDAVRLSMGLLIETLCLPVRCFPTALDVLADGDALERVHCLVLDVRMPGLSGAEGTSSGGIEELEALSRLIAELVGEREAQRNQLDNLKFALDQHAIVSITDLAGTINYANDKFCEISGYSRGELIGRNHRIVKSAIHGPEVFADIWQMDFGSRTRY